MTELTVGAGLARGLAHKAAGNNRGSGPPFTRVGWRSVRYRVSDLRAWAEKTAQRIE